MYNSTIKRKYCRCSDDCTKMPTISFGGYYYSHAPQEIKDAQGLKAKKGYQDARKRANLNSLSKQVKEYAKDKGALKSSNSGLKTLMAKADEVFSKWIRNRDADKNGNVACVCCGKIYNLKDKTLQGDTVIQALHFVVRSVYSYRYSETAVNAGCCYCNMDMNENPKDGVAYKQYREYMVSVLGEFLVGQIETEKYKINRISHSELEGIIKKYSK